MQTSLMAACTVDWLTAWHTSSKCVHDIKEADIYIYLYTYICIYVYIYTYTYTYTHM